MKKLYLIGGTMGVGKTTVCQILKEKLPGSVFLDGDWCWDMHPFAVTEETKRMVIDNICYLLNSFLKCQAYRNIIFCWVMHEQTIIDSIRRQLDLTDVDFRLFTLMISDQALKARLRRDIDAGVRTQDIIARSLARLPFYDKITSEKIDVSRITAGEAAEEIAQRLIHTSPFPAQSQIQRI